MSNKIQTRSAVRFAIAAAVLIFASLYTSLAGMIKNATLIEPSPSSVR